MVDVRWVAATSGMPRSSAILCRRCRSMLGPFAVSDDVAEAVATDKPLLGATGRVNWSIYRKAPRLPYYMLRLTARIRILKKSRSVESCNLTPSRYHDIAACNLAIQVIVIILYYAQLHYSTDQITRARWSNASKLFFLFLLFFWKNTYVEKP
jgi:hypothetical protein